MLSSIPAFTTSGVATAAGFSRRCARVLAGDPLAAAAVLYLGLVITLALGAAHLTAFSYDQQQLADALQGPSRVHLLGTDNFGRDLLTRIAFGARISLTVAAVAVAAEVALGLAWGTVAGFLGGAVDGWMMRVVDLLIAFPALLLAILITGMFGPSLVNVVIALVVTAWPGMARVIRSEVLLLREREFVEGARACGASPGRVIARHLVPNLWHLVVVRATLDAGVIILLEATLSFVGVGVQPPRPSWGSMINAAFAYIRSQPSLLLVPTVFLSLTVLALNTLGESLADRLDPQASAR
jgi:ABC-type dipeptide/oligopeptide/nickel transport system permease subunit